MADILPFNKNARKAKAAKASTLCREGHHKWTIVTKQQFDVKQGRLVTVFECQHCGKRRVKAL
jgi:hypothetical protein